MDESFKNLDLGRLPVHPVASLCLFTQANEQVLAEHAGHVYFGDSSWQEEQTGSISPGSIQDYVAALVQQCGVFSQYIHWEAGSVRPSHRGKVNMLVLDGFIWTIDRLTSMKWCAPV
jgi:hypothetical protein